ncbi:hypothetical protein KR222_009904 [Zaprionus bogoriensis]|nr:hypothetical protein KR222_009904 [Zaprionus bogoriensis]
MSMQEGAAMNRKPLDGIDSNDASRACGRGVRGLIQMFEQFNVYGLKSTTAVNRPQGREGNGVSSRKSTTSKQSIVPTGKARTLTLLVNGRPVARSVRRLPKDVLCEAAGEP